MSNMHQGLDLSRFKKISSDKQTSTLRHSQGHEIRIAHSGLTPKMREKIDSLPVYLAEGGDPTVSGEDVDPAPVEGGDDEKKAEEPETQPPAAATAPVVETPAPQPAAVAPVTAAPQAAPSAPVPVAPPTPSQEIKQEGDAYNQDLQMGHIKPETYSDLFAKKSTLGKIGTMFGLLISGAGSGLAHQSNAVMDMMNREISNDLEAQKATQSNAQNIYQLNLKHQMQQADIKNQQIQQQIALSKNPSEIQHLESSAKNLDTQAKTTAAALSRIQMNWNALHKLTTDIKKIPATLPDGTPNPTYEKAQQQLLMLHKTIQGENYSIADQADASLGLVNALGGGASSGEQGFQKGQTALRVSDNTPLAEDRAARHIPGVKGMASIPLTGQDREEVLAGTQFQNQLGRFMDWTKHHSGDLNLKDRAEGEALAAQLQGAYRLATKGGVYKEGEQGFISNVIDSTPTKFFNEIRVMPKLQAVQRESAAQLNDRLKAKGFDGYQGPEKVAQKSEGKFKEGQTGATKDGTSVIYKGGKWVPQAKVSKK